MAFSKFHNALEFVESSISNKFGGDVHDHTHETNVCAEGLHKTPHRFKSFSDEREGNDIKWYVDGCGYMWAVSEAIEKAKDSIWILDWWLSPELYLRRPPARNQQWRIDLCLKRAADRGVKVNVIVYKEVPQALTRKFHTPALPDYFNSLVPASTHQHVRTLARLGLDATLATLEVESAFPLMPPPVPVSSAHTKHALEELSPNIFVFRHPDHLPDAKQFSSSLWSSLQNMKLNAATAAKLPGDALKALYGVGDETVLYWAHHEKLLLVDGLLAFMGGLDLCYGRWDTNQHPIADAHPADLNDIVFPGQDFNNARIMDFQDVDHWRQNKLDRTQNSRMGWSDVSVSLSGPVVEDLKRHFVQRWNYIFDEKYDTPDQKRYARLTMQDASSKGGLQHSGQGLTGHMKARLGARGDRIERGLEQHEEHIRERFERRGHEAVAEKWDDRLGQAQTLLQGEDLGRPQPTGVVKCQIVRSCCKWSHGVPLEHSIASAYIQTIRDSQHFVYIENQFFITATSAEQEPFKNKIGAAIVERILRAARAGERYKVFVVMPSVPGFAGNLKSDAALGTRAIMEYQYNSINRGGHSIMELVAKEGFDPTEYIRFYNLRNYDRINTGAAMKQAEEKSGIAYQDARADHDEKQETQGHGGGDADKYQQAADSVEDPNSWTVSSCYMEGGEDIRSVPWTEGNVPEIDAFVSEELYVHTKLLIADDRVVICGSANLNDRSQLGSHDSEIAIVVEDSAPVESTMNGQPWQATRFAASLRRQIFRKHLGLLKPQDMTKPDGNFQPVGVPNEYDWNSELDQAVVDPLSDQFLNYWNTRARNNTEAFEKVFHPVPSDNVRSWKAYDEWYNQYFGEQNKEKPPLYKHGHVVTKDFSAGEQGAKEVKEILSTVKGTLVEMPLLFLIDEDMAKEGLSLNALTEVLYT